MIPKTTLRVAVLGAFVVMLVAGSTASAVALQESNTTATPTATPTASSTDCDPEDPPELTQARLHTRDDTIDEGSPGVIAGGFLPEAGIECPIVVRIALSVPNNMYVEGTTRIGTGGAGMVAGQFTISPETEDVKSVRANVYSTDAGERSVTADIEYWPEGHSELKKTISGLTLTFTVSDPPPGTPTAEPADGDSDDEAASGLPDLTMTQLLAIAIGGLTLIGTVAAYTKGLDTLNIGLS